MFKFLYPFIFTLIFYSTILSQEPNTMKSSTESWYFYFGFGYSKMFYPSDIQETVDELLELEDVSHLPLTWEMFAFYLHLAPKTIGGIIFTGAGDRYDRSERGGIQINQYTFGGSIIHYTGTIFGTGLFLRTDLGLASKGEDEFGAEENGFGILVGSGWSFDLGGTRLLFNGNYTYRLFKSGAYHTLTVSIGGLF